MANVKDATHHFANVITENDIRSMRLLRNFWEHEDDYPLLDPPHVMSARKETQELLSEYGRSPALRSLGWRSNVSQSLIISTLLDAGELREKARVLVEQLPPRDGNSSIKQPRGGNDSVNPL